MKNKIKIQYTYTDELGHLISSSTKNAMSFQERVMAYHASEAIALRVAFEPKRQKLPKEDFRSERDEG